PSAPARPPTRAGTGGVLHWPGGPGGPRPPPTAFGCRVDGTARDGATGSGVLTSSHRRRPTAVLGRASISRSPYKTSGTTASQGDRASPPTAGRRAPSTTPPVAPAQTTRRAPGASTRPSRADRGTG